MTTYNLTTDFGAVPAPTDSSHSLDLWYASFVDGDTLVIPGNSFHWGGTIAPTPPNANNVTIIGQPGATVDNLFLGKSNILFQDFSHSVRIASVSAGATSVTVIPQDGSLSGAADVSLLAVGRVMMICGWPIQAGATYPPAFEWFEFRTITSIVGNIAFFAEPLLYSYDATWPYIDAAPVSINIATSTFTCLGAPVFNGTTVQNAFFTTTGSLPTPMVATAGYFVVNASGQNFQISNSAGGAPISLSGTQSGSPYFHAGNYDVAGPATAYLMSSIFLGTQNYSGIRCTFNGGGINCGAGENLILDAMTFDGNGPSFSMGSSALIKNSVYGNQNEIDKCLSRLEYSNSTGVGLKQLLVQTASVGKLILSNGTIVTTVNGTPLHFEVDPTCLVDTIFAGPGFGRTEEIIVVDGSVTTIAPTSHLLALSAVSFNGGVFALAKNSNNLYDGFRLFVPGYKYAIGWNDGSGASEVIVDDVGKSYIAKLLSVTQDPNFIYYFTDLPALPTTTFFGHPANSIFAYGTRRLMPANSFASVNGLVEPPDAIVGPTKRLKHYAMHV